MHDGHQQNRKLWNEIADVHYRHPDYHVAEFLKDRCSLKPIELEILGDVQDLDLLHLQCHFGKDTLSWVRRGARAVGVDISDRSIELAGQLARETGLSADFICCDILDLIGRTERRFDIVFQSYGTPPWLGDMSRWGQTVAHHLKTGGRFLIVDSHPIWPVLGWPEEELGYFETEPRRYQDDPDYCDRHYIPANDSLQWQHSVGEVLNALIQAGMTIESFREYDKGFYPVKPDWYQEDSYWYPPGGSTLFPLMFSLLARKG